MVLIPFRKGFESSHFGFITVVVLLPCCSGQACYRGCPKELPMEGGERGIKKQLLNPFELGHRWLGSCGFSDKKTARKDVKVLVQGVESLEGELSLGWCGMGGTWVSCDLVDVTWDTFLALSLISLCMRAPSRAGWQWSLQKCLLVAVLQETLSFSLQSTSPGWVFLTVQAKCTCYHSGLAAGPSCASFPDSPSSRVHAEKWKIQNSSLGHNFTFFSFFFHFFLPSWELLSLCGSWCMHGPAFSCWEC